MRRRFGWTSLPPPPGSRQAAYGSRGLAGGEGWQILYLAQVINWQAMVDLGTISQKDVDDLLFTDDVAEAYEFITSSLAPNKLAMSPLFLPAKASSAASKFQL